MSTDLPIEHELIDGAIYGDDAAEYWLSHGELVSIYNRETFMVRNHKLPLRRFGPVAEYRPAALEPIGLGAVVRDASGSHWIRYWGGKFSWSKAEGGRPFEWAEIAQPVTILAEGVIV